MVVVEQCSGLVWALGFHIDEAGGFAQRALRAEYQAVSIIGSAVGHVVALRATYLIAGEVGRGEEFDFGNNDGLVAGSDSIGGRVVELVGGDKECIRGRVEDAGFVKVRGSWVVDKELEGGRGPEEGKKRIMVDEKRASLCG